MKEIKLTPEQIKDNQKSELIDDLLATATVKEEVWRYHPDNPNKKDVVKEYDILCQIERDLEAELDDLS
tara:strand:+ start:277 stop:483 length:207 start_codon:yes stop_codon:yes gene_type:complete